MFKPISINDYIEKYKKANPKNYDKNIREILIETVRAKKNGAVCNQCGQPIWAIGSATVGWNGCFTCITMETDNSDDYEIEDVCF